MLLLTNTAEQTVQPGQPIIFNKVLLHSGCAEGCGLGERIITISSVRIKAKGIEAIMFNGNITAADPAQINIEVDGNSLQETTIISNSASTKNVSAQTRYRVNCSNISVRVVNTGANPIIVAAGALLTLERRA